MSRTSSDDLLSTDAGLEALYEAAFACGVSTASWPRPADAQTIVHWLEALERRVPEIASVLARARLRVRYRGAVPATLELVAKERRASDTSKRAADDLEQALVAQLEARGFPSVARVAAVASEEETWWALTLPSRWMRVVTEAKTESLAYRTAAASIAFAPKTGHLRVVAEDHAHAAIVAAAFGVAHAGDARFFRPLSILSLQPFQSVDENIDVPDELASSVARIRLIDCDWDSGRAIAVSFRGSNVPKEMAQLGLRIDSGRLHSAVLRVELTSAPHRCDVTLRAPNEITCSEPSREPLVRKLLVALKVITNEEAPVDLWSLEPWTPSTAEARAFFGADFDALCAEGVLVRSQSRAVAHPDHPNAGRVLIAFPIEGEKGAWYGVSERAAVPSRSLCDEDLVTWRLKMKPLGARLARALRLTGSVRVLERRGVVELGTARIGPTRVRLFLVTRAPVDPMALAARLRVRAMPGHAVLLVPPGRKTRTGLAEVELANVAGPYEEVLAEVARAMGLTKHIDPLALAPRTARVVVHRASRCLWVDGVLIVPLPDQAYRLAEILAMRAGDAMNTKELGQVLTPGRSDDAITRQAKRALLKAIAASFAREKRALPADVERIVEQVRRGEVRMGVEAFVA